MPCAVKIEGDAQYYVVDLVATDLEIFAGQSPRDRLNRWPILADETPRLLQRLIPLGAGRTSPGARRAGSRYSAPPTQQA